MSTTPTGSSAPERVFEQLGRLRLREHSLESALQEVVDRTKESVPGASEVSVSVLTQGRVDTVGSTGQLAVDLDESQYQRGYGPCLEAALQLEVMHIDDASVESRWGDYTRVAVERGSLSSVSIPITVHDTSEISAALNVYGTQPHAFDETGVRTTATLAGYAEFILANLYAHQRSRVLVQRLAQAMDTRRIIDQAKGVVMGSQGCTERQASAWLAAASQRNSISLREMAQETVSTVTRRNATRHQP